VKAVITCSQAHQASMLLGVGFDRQRGTTARPIRNPGVRNGSCRRSAAHRTASHPTAAVKTQDQGDSQAPPRLHPQRKSTSLLPQPERTPTSILPYIPPQRRTRSTITARALALIRMKSGRNNTTRITERMQKPTGIVILPAGLAP